MSSAPSDAEVLKLIADELRPGPDGRLVFPDVGERRLQGLVVMAAYHPDEERGASALVNVMRLALALNDRAPRAAKQLTNALKGNPAALRRLERFRSGALTRERFGRAFGAPGPVKSAPLHDAPARPGELRPADFHLRGTARRLDAAEARARRRR